jgi:ABC-2 type transport system permease protein
MTKLIHTEWKLFLREPVVAFWGVVFPVALLIVLGIASDGPEKDFGGISLVQAYVPVLVGFTLAMIAVSVLPAMLGTYREKGILRRLQATPVPPSRLLVAQIAVHVAVILLATLLMLVVARLAFDVGLPGDVLGFVVAYVLSAAALLAIGLVIAAAAPSGRTANAVGAILFFPMMFFAGLWIPREAMGETLRQVSNYTPLGAGVGALQDAMQGDFPRPLHLDVLAAWTILALAAARSLFRWD